MTNPIKARVSADGMFATPVNPYSYNSQVEYQDGKGEYTAYIGFSKANPQRPLTSPQTPNSKIECREVWEFCFKGMWIKDSTEQGKFKSFSDYKASMDSGYNTRIAFEPLTAPVDGVCFDEWPTAIEAENIVWNNALDEATRVLENIAANQQECRLDYILTKLNTLRK